MPERFRVVAPSAVPLRCGTLSCCDVEPASGPRDRPTRLRRHPNAQVEAVGRHTNNARQRARNADAGSNKCREKSLKIPGLESDRLIGLHHLRGGRQNV